MSASHHMTSEGKQRIVVFDADDTLWDCQGHFEVVMQRLYEELLPWTHSLEESARQLFATERKNMHLLGYGVKAFTLSIIETAMRVSKGEMPVTTIQALLNKCYTLLEFPTTPLPHVADTLAELQRRGYPLVVFTKGELLDQQHKLERSGLQHFFCHLEITSDKGEAEFLALTERLGASPDQLLMVGNSLRSDVAPALAAGWQAVHIPFHVTWELEQHDAFEHPNLTTISRFDHLLSLLP